MAKAIRLVGLSVFILKKKFGLYFWRFRFLFLNKPHKMNKDWKNWIKKNNINSFDLLSQKVSIFSLILFKLLFLNLVYIFSFSNSPHRDKRFDVKNKDCFWYRGIKQVYKYWPKYKRRRKRPRRNSLSHINFLSC